MKPAVLAIYFDDPAPLGYPFSTPEYLESYSDFSDVCRKNNVTPYIVRGAASYQGNMVFNHGWIITNKTLTEVNTPFKADIIYRKGHKLVTGSTDVIVNHADIEKLCSDKWETYQQFSQVMAPCWQVTPSNLLSVAQQASTNLVVVKPVQGTEGRDIIIKLKNDITPSDVAWEKDTYILQEFVDSSTGIPGLCEGLHDLRLYTYNGVAHFAEIRQPKSGSYLANIAQGASFALVPLSAIPASAVEFFKKVDATLSKYYPRLYTVDLMYSHGQPYLVELNSQPGLPYKIWEQYDQFYSRSHQLLLETLLKALP